MKAYGVQTQLAGLAGDEVPGWKVTALNADQQNIYGIKQPVAGAMLAPFALAAPATLALSHFVAPLLECEIAYRRRRDLPARDSVIRAGDREAVEALIPAMRLLTALAGGFARPVQGCRLHRQWRLHLRPAQWENWRVVDLAAIEVLLMHENIYDGRAR